MNVGEFVGLDVVGAAEGWIVGAIVGSTVSLVGTGVGESVGAAVGDNVGACVGLGVGCGVRITEGRTTTSKVSAQESQVTLQFCLTDGLSHCPSCLNVPQVSM